MGHLIPFATTTVTIVRPNQAVDVDPSDTPVVLSPVASGVRATVTVPTGMSNLIAAHSTTNNATLYVDPGTDVQPEDEVTDDATGDVWTVINLNVVYALIPHISALLRQKTAVTA